jgi:pimeloyl-ACP methyl ester carboxylesterase
MASIKPYQIAVPQTQLDILKKKLELATFPDELDGADWNYGCPLADIKRLTTRWRDGYNWRTAEARLNEFPQFTTDIPIDGYETFKVHFIHQKSMVKNAIPLIFVHGWPGSFDEVTKILPELLKGGKDQPAFHVVAPSLVNFGFSQGTKNVGIYQLLQAIFVFFPIALQKACLQ